MLNISQKCQYALRAILELAKTYGHGTVNVSQIAAAQAIPPRFLELILGELRKGGFVLSRRGVQGGYELASEPQALTAGDIIRFIDGPLDPVACVSGDSAENCAFGGNCAFLPMWQRAKEAISKVYDSVSFADLLEQERKRLAAISVVANYAI